MTDRQSISHIHWQIKLRQAGTGHASGEIVTDYDDIEQEIRIIVMTPIGSVPTNPLKGCDLMPLIDLPGEIASPLVCQAVFDAINIWVSRVEVGTVTATAIAAHHWVVHIPWRVKNDVLADFRLLEMDLSLGGMSYAL